MKNLYLIEPLRRLTLPLLAKFGDRDISVRHAWHRDHQIRLNLFRHKGYWFHGKRREEDLMNSLARLVSPGSHVAEVGCHIGWISLHLRKLVGNDGKLYAFEPSPNNLPYLKANLASFDNVEIIELAVADRIGEATFYVEPLTGQNDTLVQDYAVFDNNRALAFSDATYKSITVGTTTLDTQFSKVDDAISLIKIDVEGAERDVLQGGEDFVRRHRPAIAIEVTREYDWVEQFFRNAEYAMFTERLEPADDEKVGHGNWFFLPKERGLSS